MKSKHRYTCFTILLTIFVVGIYSNANAAYVLKTKGKKLLIKLDDADLVKANELYYVVDYNGKKKAIIAIKKTRGGKALAVVRKGKAKTGWTLIKRPSKINPKVAQASTPHSTPSSKDPFSPIVITPAKKTLPIGFMWSYNTNSLDTASTKLKGSSFLNLESHYRIPLNDKISIRALFGIQEFNAEAAAANCPGTSKCSIEILYSYLGGLASVDIPLSSTFLLWVGVGGKLLFPFSKTVAPTSTENFIDEDSIKLTSHLLIGGGFEWTIHPKIALPINFLYQIGPKSDTVTSPTALGIQTGLIYHF